MKKNVVITCLLSFALLFLAVVNWQWKTITTGDVNNLSAPTMSTGQILLPTLTELSALPSSSSEPDVHPSDLDEMVELEKRLVPGDPELVTYIENCLVLESMTEWGMPGLGGILGLDGERIYLYSLDKNTEFAVEGFPANQKISSIYSPSPDNKWIIVSGYMGDELDYWMVGKDGKAYRLETWPAGWGYWVWENSTTLRLAKRNGLSNKLFNPFENTIQEVPYSVFFPEELVHAYANYYVFPPLASYSPTRQWLLYTNELGGGLTLWNTETREKRWVWRGEFSFVVWLNDETALVAGAGSNQNAELYKVNVHGNRHQITNVAGEFSKSMGQRMGLSPDGRYIATWLIVPEPPYYTFVIIDLEESIMTNYCIPFEFTSALLWDKEGKNVIFATDFAPDDQAMGKATVLFNLDHERVFVLAEGVTPRIWWFPE